MHSYRVVDLSLERSVCALQSKTGAHHVARALGRLPALNAVLLGDSPHLGFGILVCEGSGAMFRMIFETINDAPPAPDPSWRLNAPPPTPRSQATQPPSSGD